MEAQTQDPLVESTGTAVASKGRDGSDHRVSRGVDAEEENRGGELSIDVIPSTISRRFHYVGVAIRGTAEGKVRESYLEGRNFAAANI